MVKNKRRDAYDALTLVVEQADALTEHVAIRLSDLSDGEPRELYALSLIAEDIRAKHALIVEKAKALNAAAKGKAQ